MACALGDGVPTIADRPGVARRITLLSIDERPSGHDPVIAAGFCRFRARLGLPAAELSRRLNLPLPVLKALESGNLKQLPPLHTFRTAIRDYGHLAHFDAESIMRRLEAQTSERPPLPQTGRPGQPGSLRENPALSRAAGQHSSTRRRNHPHRRPRAFVWVMLAVLPIGIGASLILDRMDLRSVHRLIENWGLGDWSLEGRSVAAPDALRRGYARSGPRWIEVDDPRTRKADRLPASQPLVSSR